VVQVNYLVLERRPRVWLFEILDDEVGLGDLEKQLNISELIHLSAEEIDKKVHLKELALQRQKFEIKEQNSEVEKLINDDFNHQEKEDIFLNHNKVSLLQEESKKVFVKFLESNHIGFLELKEGTIKLSSENLKKLFNLLKANMSDKRTNALAYKEERKVLQKMNRLKELKVSFKTNNNDEFQTLYLYLNHPIIAMIIRDKNQKTVYSVLSHKKYSDGFAIIYRVDFKQLKAKSMIRVLVVDTNLALVDELDYFEFIANCSEVKAEPSVNLEALKAKLNAEVIQSIEQHKRIESESQNRLIDIKINSMENYFEKQINKVKRLQNKVQQEDIQRMRIGEIDNLENRRDEKIGELMGQKDGSLGFEVLGVLEIGGEDE